MQRKGGVVDVALRHDSGGIDEVLVFRGAPYRIAVEMRRKAYRLEVYVNDGVGLRQQTCRLGRRRLTQNDCNGQRNDERQYEQKRIARRSTEVTHDVRRRLSCQDFRKRSWFECIASPHKHYLSLFDDREGVDFSSAAGVGLVDNARRQDAILALGYVLPEREAIKPRCDLLSSEGNVVSLSSSLRVKNTARLRPEFAIVGVDAELEQLILNG